MDFNLLNIVFKTCIHLNQCFWVSYCVNDSSAYIIPNQNRALVFLSLLQNIKV